MYSQSNQRYFTQANRQAGRLTDNIYIAMCIFQYTGMQESFLF